MKLHAFVKLLIPATISTAFAFAGCGDDASPATSDTTSGTDTVTGDVAPGDDIATGDDTTTGTDTATGDDVATGTDTTTGTDTVVVEPGVKTATFTIDGVATTFEPDVLRSLSPPPDPRELLFQGGVTSPVALTCTPGGALLDGGAIISVQSASVTGGYNGAGCNQASVIDGMNNALLLPVANACNNQSSCSLTVYEELDQSLGLRGCSFGNNAISVRYVCQQLVPSPSFRVQGTVDGKVFAVTGIETPGTWSCADRAARLRIDGTVMQIAAEDCTITISERSERRIAGSVGMTYTDAGGQSRRLEGTFDHTDTAYQNIAVIFTGTEFCGATELAHSVETSGAGEEGATFDVITTGSLTCAASGQTTPGFELRRERLAAGADGGLQCYSGGRIEITRNGYSTHVPDGQCGYVFGVDESNEVLRLVFNTNTLCNEETSGCVSLPLVYLGFDIGRRMAEGAP